MEENNATINVINYHGKTALDNAIDEKENDDNESEMFLIGLTSQCT